MGDKREGWGGDQKKHEEEEEEKEEDKSKMSAWGLWREKGQGYDVWVGVADSGEFNNTTPLIQGERNRLY